MKILPFVLAVIPLTVYSVSQDDIAYMRNRLKEYNERMQAEISEEIGMKLHKSGMDDTTARNVPQSKPTLGDMSIGDVNKNSEIADALFENDIMLTRDQADALLETVNTRSRRQAAVPGISLTLWDRLIPFTYQSSYPEDFKKYIQYAIEVYENSTCLKFQENGTGDYKLNFTQGGGCWSFIGKAKKDQELSLDGGCQTIGHAIHEIGHALGFYHTQSRWDRDDYITVNYENIQAKQVGEFTKKPAKENNNLGLPYDYGSVMHYDQFDTSISRDLTTMDAKDKMYQWTMGSYYEAFYDILMINKLYSCNDNCTHAETKCKNGGYPNPNNCNECNCPRGFGGNLCDERPSGCGESLTASTEWKQFSDVLGYRGRIEMLFDECHYWIQAPKDKAIEIKLEQYKDGNCVGGCIYGGIEIKSQEDQRETGYRFCCNQPKYLTSNHSLVPIFTFNRFTPHNATISYRYVNREEADVTTTVANTDSVREKSTVPPTFTSTLQTVSETPTTPTVTDPAESTTYARYCYDRFPRCEEQKALGFCTTEGVGQWYQDEERKYWCQLTCNLCDWL